MFSLRKCVIPFWSGLMVLVVFLSGCAHQGSTSEVANGNEAEFDQLLDSVVRLDVWETTFEGGAKRTARGVGSGVIMTEDGLILTNAHVVNPYAERISVTLNNLERVPATLLGWDHWTDLAVVKLDADEIAKRNLTFSHAQFGDSSQLRPGQTVYAVGTPNGLTRTVSRGIISNTNRYFEGRTVGQGYETGMFNTWLQTDAAINPGNSGGPLVLPNGLVIGINTRAYLGANNLAFAVPSDIAREVLSELIEAESVSRSYIGLIPGPLQDLENFYQLEANQGMLVQSVDPGSPASTAGISPGDIVLSINGEPIDGRFPEQLPAIQHSIASSPVGSELRFEVRRGSATKVETVVSEPLESRVGAMEAFEKWGLSVQRISKAVAREEKLKSNDGVRVMGVQAGYPAAEAGVRRGDIILKVGDQSITTLDSIQAVYEGWVANPEKVLVEVDRGHQASYLVLKPR
ncbi:trypsin-like peptidase domain-containing protein [Cerasicoccus fimbriatus]|uniref:trypsin-like peptidase domain-containing protein n=1 Tax=Cerasicoccus fimbriatus TaxID=3014554 RepID=UPI0022B3F90F|nr:trypsin-like peptidase domain-containing protein [Cerasicoccus sp. TK19100]